MEIASLLRQLIVLMMENETIVTSWGISNIRVQESSLSFLVNGFRYQGEVIIDGTNKDALVIKMGDATKEFKNPNDIIDELDQVIESSGDYEVSLLNWLSGIPPSCKH